MDGWKSLCFHFYVASFRISRFPSKTKVAIYPPSIGISSPDLFNTDVFTKAK
jgi:hypothetical protein